MGLKNNLGKKNSYIRGLAICHGGSECTVVNAFKRDLRLPLIIDSEHNGKSSIQINSIMKYLNQRKYASLPSFLKEITDADRIQISKGRLIGFKLFIIMDTDDCENPGTLRQYINGSMFSSHWLAPYIVPIFSTPNLDYVFEKIGFHIDCHNKVGSYYSACQQIVRKNNWLRWLIDKTDDKNLIEKTNFGKFLKYLEKITERHNH